MKTAMQFLKDEIESKIIPSSRENGKLSDYQYGHNIAYSVVLTLAQYLIEVEKKQMIDFYNWMRRNDSAEGYFHYSDEDMLEEYYNQNNTCMKTAMQKLITNLETMGITFPLGIQQTFLSIEKEQIIDASCLGKYNNIDDRQKGEQYYNQTYNQNK